MLGLLSSTFECPAYGVKLIHVNKRGHGALRVKSWYTRRRWWYQIKAINKQQRIILLRGQKLTLHFLQNVILFSNTVKPVFNDHLYNKIYFLYLYSNMF